MRLKNCEFYKPTDDHFSYFYWNFRQKIYRITLQSTQAKEKISNTKKTEDKKVVKTVDREKFENYFEFKNFVDYVKPHQTMAINRGESLKVLSVKLIIPDGFKSALKNFIKAEFMRQGNQSKQRFDLFETTFEEVFTKKCKSGNFVCFYICGHDEYI